MQRTDLYSTVLARWRGILETAAHGPIRNQVVVRWRACQLWCKTIGHWSGDIN